MISGFSAAQQIRQVPSRIHGLPSSCIAILSGLDVTLQLAHPFTLPRRLQQLQVSHPQRTWFNWARKEAGVKKRIQINFKCFFFFLRWLSYLSWENIFPENLHRFPLISHWPEVGHMLILNQSLDRGSGISPTPPLPGGRGAPQGKKKGYGFWVGNWQYLPHSHSTDSFSWSCNTFKYPWPSGLPLPDTCPFSPLPFPSKLTAEAI